MLTVQRAAFAGLTRTDGSLSSTEGLAGRRQKDYENSHVEILALLALGCPLMSASLAPQPVPPVSPSAPSGSAPSSGLGDVSALSFEEALAELEKIVRGLESGQQKLEEAITAFERGSALRRHCEAKLAEAETRIQAIVERADGTLDTRPIG
jgi:exodeoxyribonuclease VII small subunit